MTKHLADVSVTPEAFAEACEKARFASRGNKKVFEQLIALTDFLTFKKLMVKRNMELELEAVRELQQQSIPIVAPVDEDEAEKLFQMALKESAEMSASEAQAILEKARAAAEAENSKEPDLEDGAGGAASDNELRKAMDLNLMELELQNRQFEMEQQELEQALAMSLFMEEERLRVAEEEEFEEFEDDNEDEDSYEEVVEVARAEVKETSSAKDEEDVKGQDKEETVNTAIVSEPKPKPEIQTVDTSSKVSEASVQSANDSKEAAISVSTFNPSSLQAAPKLTERIEVNQSKANSGAAEEVLSETPKKKKKKKKSRKDKVATAGPLTGLSPIGGTPQALPGLAPLPSIEDLQKQMQKRRLETEVRLFHAYC